MRLWSLSLPPEARWIGSPAHCCRPLQQDEMTCQKRMAAIKHMKPICLTNVLFLPGFVLAAFDFTEGVPEKHAGSLWTTR